MTRKLTAVLAASDAGPMIINRLDYQTEDGGRSFAGVGCQVLETGGHDPGEVAMLVDLLEARRRVGGAGVVVVDGGANVGMHSVAIGKAMSGWGSVHAFEPQERLFYMLAGNVALNNVWNVRAYWAALAERDGAIPAPDVDYEQPRNFGGVSFRQDGPQAAGAATVPAIRIDRFRLRRLDLLKLDVEGMEPQALAGARETVARCRPIVFFEHATCGLDAGLRHLPPGYGKVHDLGAYALCFHESDEVGSSVRFGEAV